MIFIHVLRQPLDMAASHLEHLARRVNEFSSLHGGRSDERDIHMFLHTQFIVIILTLFKKTFRVQTSQIKQMTYLLTYSYTLAHTHIYIYVCIVLKVPPNTLRLHVKVSKKSRTMIR
jgi:hypothetical protein